MLFILIKELNYFLHLFTVDVACPWRCPVESEEKFQTKAPQLLQKTINNELRVQKRKLEKEIRA